VRLLDELRHAAHGRSSQVARRLYLVRQHWLEVLHGDRRQRNPPPGRGRLPAVSPLLASTDITAFHVLGALLALWALVLTALGVTRPDFPGKASGQKVVMAISALLVAGTIGTAIGTGKNAPKAGAEAGKVTTTGTGANAGQQPGGAAQPAAPGGTVTTLVISADPTGQLRFDKSTLAAPAGNVRITMQNPSPVQHNVSLQGPGGLDKHGPTVSKGGASQVEAALKPGTYTYYCSVPGHRQAGMQGTLAVK
jgi:plastocyanin